MCSESLPSVAQQGRVGGIRFRATPLVGARAGVGVEWSPGGRRPHSVLATLSSLLADPFPMCPPVMPSQAGPIPQAHPSGYVSWVKGSICFQGHQAACP